VFDPLADLGAEISEWRKDGRSGVMWCAKELGAAVAKGYAV